MWHLALMALIIELKQRMDDPRRKPKTTNLNKDVELSAYTGSQNY
jgi:hypothetical protein